MYAYMLSVNHLNIYLFIYTEMTFNCVPRTVAKCQIGICILLSHQVLFIHYIVRYIGQTYNTLERMYSFHFHVSFAMERICFDIVFSLCCQKAGMVFVYILPKMSSKVYNWVYFSSVLLKLDMIMQIKCIRLF